MYLCVDCGGSKTSAVLADRDGQILGRALGGPSNFAYLTMEGFVTVVKDTITDALKNCNPSFLSLPPSPGFAAAWFGISGVDSPSSVARLTPVLSDLLGIPAGPNLIIGNDTQLLAAPLQTLEGVTQAVTVVAGTGSITVSFEQVDGRIQELGRVGGWGWILGDEGGGFYVGRELLRQVLLEHDQASVASIAPEPTRLKTRMMECFSVTTIPDILAALHMADPASTTADSSSLPHLRLSREKRLSSLAPLAFEAAFENKDPLAINVLRTCAGMLASQIAVLVGNRDGRQPRVVEAQNSVISFGGSLVAIEGYRQMILDDLESKGFTFKTVAFVDDAAATGAFALAASFRQ
ncbi:hypothetical protein C8J56DRAFT_1002107 [Mycena floridula]|nr:hypothetical protein C8J56DRAFT_1002107 [Mycena floridula]